MKYYSSTCFIWTKCSNETPAIGTQNNYKFGSKELQDEFGLNELDFGARFYDPAIARWAQLDPMAEGAADWTPYRYAFNNPMGYNDPSGMFEMPKGQFPDGFDNGCGLHLPWESGGSWSGSFGGVGSINGHYNYYCTNNAQEPVYNGGASNGYVYNEITKTYQKDGQDVPFSEVLASMSENGGATQGVMDYVWRSNITGEIAPPGSDLKNSYRSLEVVDSGIPVAKGEGGSFKVNEYREWYGDIMGLPVGGLKIEITYAGTSSMESAKWMQLISVKKPRPGEKNPFNDGYPDALPYYLTSDEMKRFNLINGNSITFTDNPYNSEDESFRANTFLFLNGQIIFSFSYGYDYNKKTGIVTKIPLITH